jgi:hypothetical protein
VDDLTGFRKDVNLEVNVLCSIVKCTYTNEKIVSNSEKCYLPLVGYVIILHIRERTGGRGMFVNTYLIGLLTGLGTYALTFLFSKNIENKKRVLILIIVGFLTLLGSIFLIGGFEGMPYGVLGVGILSTSFLFSFFGKSSLWKKSVYTCVLLFVVLYFGFTYINKVDYWVIKKSSYSSGDAISLYEERVQNDLSITGYKVFTILEGNKGIVLSLGGKMKGNDIEVLDVEEQGHTTLIKIRSYYNQSDEKNPVIGIGLNRVQSEIVIMDTNGTLYEEVSE